VNDDVVVLAHGETTCLEAAAVPEDTPDVKVLKVFEAGEAAKALASFLDPQVGIECVERVAVRVGNPMPLSSISKLLTSGRLPSSSVWLLRCARIETFPSVLPTSSIAWMAFTIISTTGV
jgi:hypothetical protein